MSTYGLAAPSTASGARPAYGRAWKITITGETQETIIDNVKNNNYARVVFDTYQPGYREYAFCDLQIYNLDAPTQNNLITQGAHVTVEAGYDNGVNYGKIFDGKVFQPTWTRENVTDYVLGLHCITGFDYLLNNFISAVHSRFATQVEIVRKIADEADKKIQLDPATLTAKFNAQKLARTQVSHGAPQDEIDDLAVDNAMVLWSSGEKTVMGHLSDTGGQTIVYSPNTGILGTPQQIQGGFAGMVGAPVITQGGVQFRVLLDSRLEVKLPPVRVQINNTSIRAMLYQIKQNPSILDQDGLYVVGGVRHVGDTRGQDWYTDVTGYTVAMITEIVNAQLGIYD
jgi:Baseplate hub gp41